MQNCFAIKPFLSRGEWGLIKIQQQGRKFGEFDANLPPQNSGQMSKSRNRETPHLSERRSESRRLTYLGSSVVNWRFGPCTLASPGVTLLLFPLAGAWLVSLALQFSDDAGTPAISSVTVVATLSPGHWPVPSWSA